MDANNRRERETDEASRWWVRLGTRGPHEVSQQDREQFTRWLRESPLNVAEILHIARVHDALERFKLWKEVSVDLTEEGENLIPLRPLSPHGAEWVETKGFRLFPVMVTAAAAATVVTAAFLLPWLGGETIATETAERREVMLDDGSVVRLEPQTSLRVRLEARERHVTLQRGRALFRVAKDPNRPFLVEAEATVVRAVGTAFGVERKNRSIIVTVSEGKVAVVKREREVLPQPGKQQKNKVITTPSAIEEDEGGASLFLTAGQQVTVRHSGSADIVRKVDTVRALAWSEGRLVFDSAPLSDVVDEFNRYNHQQLRVDDPELARRPVSGVFQASDPETLIAFIRTGARVNVIRPSSQQILIAPSSPN